MKVQHINENKTIKFDPIDELLVPYKLIRRLKKEQIKTIGELIKAMAAPLPISSEERQAITEALDNFGIVLDRPVKTDKTEDIRECWSLQAESMYDYAYGLTINFRRETTDGFAIFYRTIIDIKDDNTIQIQRIIDKVNEFFEKYEEDCLSQTEAEKLAIFIENMINETKLIWKTCY